MYGRSSGGSGGAPPPQVPFRAGPPAGGPEPEPSGRSLLWLLIPIGLIAIALAMILLARGGSSGGPNAMVEAAQKTARISGAKMAMEVTYSAEGSPNSIVGTGGGSYNAKTGRSESKLSVPIPGQPTLSMESVGNARVVYLRSPMFAGQLPSGTEWLGLEPLLGRSEETAFGSDGNPQSSMQMMKAVGSVEKLDQQTVRGHLTTRYKGDVDMSKAADFLAANGEKALAKEYESIGEKGPDKVEFEAWIDHRGLARQLREIVQLPGVDGHDLTMDMRMQFYDFGAKPKIELPSKHLVLDETPVLRAELGLTDGHSLGSLKAAAGAKALSRKEFRARAVAVCHQIQHEALGLARDRAGLMNEMKHMGPDASTDGAAESVGNAYGRGFEEPVDRVLQRGLLRMARLKPPAADAADYERLLRIGVEESEWTLAQARAVRLGQYKLPGLEAHKAEAKAKEAEAERIARKIGLGACEKGGDLAAEAA